MVNGSYLEGPIQYGLRSCSVERRFLWLFGGLFRQQAFKYAILAALFIVSPRIWGNVTDVTITDVTTRAFSVVWFSDGPALDATVRVYNDEAGLDEITPDLSINLVSTNFPPALEQGIAKVDVTGIAAATTSLYIQTITTDQLGTVLFPETAPFIKLKMAVETVKVNDLNGPIVNDLISHNVLDPDGVTPTQGTLVQVKVPSHSIFPVTGFVGDGLESPSAMADLNDLFNDQSGTSVEIDEGTVLEITEFRGSICSPANHKLLRYRKTPSQNESPPVTGIEIPDLCFFADTVCDDKIDILDVQRVLNIFDAAQGDCKFNPDLDIVDDAVIDILDVQSVLNRFGQQSPFE